MELNISLLQVEQVSQSYVDWFANVEVVRYSENQYHAFSLKGQREYVESCIKNVDISLYGIFDGSFHIGNIALSGLKSVHKRAELTYVIGETQYWGKGVASFAISNLIKIGKTKHNLNKLYAGVASDNIGSKIVLEKNGFTIEGIREKHLFFNGKFFNQVDYGLVL